MTVVVPIYRAEKYLDQCIESITEQSYRNLEILLIDDGSDDDCPRICDDWAVRDDRIRVIHRENEGLSSARNLGIRLAKGEYLCFVDSDDFLEKTALEEARKRDADVVVFGYSDVDSKGNLLESFVSRVEKSRFNGDEVLEKFLPLFIAGGRKTGVYPLRSSNVDFASSFCFCASIFFGKSNSLRPIFNSPIVTRVDRTISDGHTSHREVMPFRQCDTSSLFLLSWLCCSRCLF